MATITLEENRNEKNKKYEIIAKARYTNFEFYLWGIVLEDIGDNTVPRLSTITDMCCGIVRILPTSYSDFSGKTFLRFLPRQECF